MENKCYRCGALMKVSPRTGKLYCSALCWKGNQQQSVPQNGNAILLDEIKLINERLDKLIAYIIKNLPEK